MCTLEPEVAERGIEMARLQRLAIIEARANVIGQRHLKDLTIRQDIAIAIFSKMVKPSDYPAVLAMAARTSVSAAEALLFEWAERDLERLEKHRAESEQSIA